MPIHARAYIPSQYSKSCLQLRTRTPGGSDCRKHTVIVKQCNDAHTSVGTAAFTLTDETLFVRSITCYFIKMHFEVFSGCGVHIRRKYNCVAFLKGCNILKLVMEVLLLKITDTNISIQFSQRNYNRALNIAAPLTPNIPAWPPIDSADKPLTIIVTVH